MTAPPGAVDSMSRAGCIVRGALPPASCCFFEFRVNSYPIDTSEGGGAASRLNIGRMPGARLTKVVFDPGCAIREGLVVGEDPALDADALLPQRGGRRSS